MRISDTCRYCGLVNGYEVTATVCRDLAACNARIALRQAVPLTAEEHRAALTRALTAQAWTVACCWLEDVGREAIVSPEYHCLEFVERMATLPAPADLAAELMGDR